MMMSSSSGRSSGRFPFTATQWQELEHQALVFKYMVSGMPVPSDLLFTIRRSLDSSLSSKFHLLHHQQPPCSQHTTINGGWNSGFQMGFGRKIDPEPGRCRRTDGKKWRCSKEAYPDSKYCERHMHRGRNRSRKPVENNNILLSSPAVTPSSATTKNSSSSPPTAIPISKHYSSSISSSSSPTTTNNISAHESHFLYNHQNPTTNFFLDSNASNYSHHAPPPKDIYRNSYGHEMKRETAAGYNISEANNFNSGTIGTAHDNSPWQLSPILTMGSDQMKISKTSYNLTAANLQQNHHYYSCIERDDDSKKVMHHFLDESPPKDHSESNHHRRSATTTQLSISTPNSLHDFFNS